MEFPAVFRSLLAGFENGRLPHALLFWGPLPLAEKEELIARLSAKILGLSRITDGGDFEKAAFSRQLPDFKFLSRSDEKDTIGVDDVLALDYDLQREPFESKNRIIYIREAQDLTLPAQNTLLKKLEEPPERNYFLLTVNRKQGLLRTVVSRSLSVYLPGNSLRVQQKEDSAEELFKKKIKVAVAPEKNVVALLHDIHEAMAEDTQLSEEQKLMFAAHALTRSHPLVAQKLIELLSLPQKISLDAVYYYSAHDFVH